MDKLITVVTERGRVSIPASLSKELGLKTGQPLVWKKISDRECLVKVPRKKAAKVMAELREGER
jgi:bifunctional DNA-binding transcriptional regulator/antitoxin component of YhaV-PrlF toxin-antitoxin module